MMLEAKRDVKYRYTCEECSTTTGLFVSSVCTYESYTLTSDIMQINAEYDPAIISQKENIALENLEKLTSILIDVLNASVGKYNFSGEHTVADLYNKTFSAGKVCPHCKSRQSWYPMDVTHLSMLKYVKFYILSFMIFGNFLGLLFGIAYITVYSISPIFLLVFQMLLLSLGCLIGFARGNYLIKKRRKTRKPPSQRYVPGVIWGEPTITVLHKY